MDEAKFGPIPHRGFQGDRKVHDLQLVFDKGPAGFAVLAAPLDVREVEAVLFNEKPGAAIGERVDVRSGAGGWIVVELGARAVEIAGVEEAVQAVIGAIERAADQSGD